MHPKRGEVYWIELDPTRDSEIQKTRPCLVVTDDILNERRNTVVVIPLSTTSPKKFPLYVPLASMGGGALAVIDQIRTVDKQRIGDRAGYASTSEMERIEEALKIVLHIE